MEDKINIYKITDRTNNKIYIGQTKRNIYRRFADHASRINSTRKNDMACSLYIAMKNHDVKNFYIELIEEVDQSNADNREQFWIKELDSTNPDKGYNLDKGGHVISDKCREARRLQMLGSKLIGKALETARNNGMKIAKAVCQYNKNNELIAEFPSIIEATRITGMDRRGIQRQLQNPVDPNNSRAWSNTKYIWKYKE